MIIDTRNPTISRAQEIIASGDNDAIGDYLFGLTKVLNEYRRLGLNPVSALVDAIDALTAALRCHDCGETACTCDELDNWDRDEPIETLNWADWKP